MQILLFAQRLIDRVAKLSNKIELVRGKFVSGEVLSHLSRNRIGEVLIVPHESHCSSWVSLLFEVLDQNGQLISVQLSRVKGKRIVMPGEVIESEGVNLFHGTKDA